MRIKKEMVEFLRAYIKKEMSGAKLYVFGSRADDKKKGGDIDILLLTKERIGFKEKSAIRTAVWKRFGEQKIDILNYTFKEENTFKELILEESIEI